MIKYNFLANKKNKKINTSLFYGEAVESWPTWKRMSECEGSEATIGIVPCSHYGGGVEQNL